MAPKEPTYKINPLGERRLLVSKPAELIYSIETGKPLALLVHEVENISWRLVILETAIELNFPTRLQALGYLEKSLNDTRRNF